MAQSPAIATPHAASLIICERVLQNATGTSFVFHGVMHSIGATAYPLLIPAGLTVALELTQGRGDVDIQVRLRHREREDRVLYDAPWRFRFEDPFDIVLQFHKIAPLIFPSPGAYLLEAIFDGVPISTRRLMLGWTDTSLKNPREGPRS